MSVVLRPRGIAGGVAVMNRHRTLTAEEVKRHSLKKVRAELLEALDGRSADVIAEALAYVTALWINTHEDGVRGTVLQLHIDLLRDLVMPDESTR